MKTLTEYIEQAIRESEKIPMARVYVDKVPPSDWDGVAYFAVEYGQTAQVDVINGMSAPQTTPLKVYAVSTDRWESEQLCRQVATFIEQKINEWSRKNDCPLVGMSQNTGITYDDQNSFSDTGNTLSQKITEMNFLVIHHIS